MTGAGWCRVHAFGVLEHPRPPSITAPHEFVVPRSMPITFAMRPISSVSTVWTRGLGAQKIQLCNSARRKVLMEHPNGKRRLYKVAFPGRKGNGPAVDDQFSPRISSFRSRDAAQLPQRRRGLMARCATQCCAFGGRLNKSQRRRSARRSSPFVRRCGRARGLVVLAAL